MRYLLIVNPASGAGKDEKKIEWVLAYFRKHGHHIDLRRTKGRGDAQKFAREAVVAKYDVVIGGGGDGTINEVLNGMIGSHVCLAILPWGTGNVFAGEMGFPRSIKRLCRMIRRGSRLCLDTGRCNGRSFLLMAGIGFDAYSLKLLEGQEMKRQIGVLAYAVSAFRAIFRYRFPQIHARFSNGRQVSGSYILVSNTSRYGNFFSFTPQADPTDGQLDLFVLRQGGGWDAFLLAVRSLLVFARQDPRFPSLLHPRHSYRTASVVISGDENVRVQLDGELADYLPVTIELVAASVEIILPRRTIKRFGK